MVDHIWGRKEILKFLKQELVGPWPLGEEIDCEKEILFDKRESSYGPWCQAGSREEILLRDRPTVRYGIGVLYPMATPTGDPTKEPDEGDNSPNISPEEDESQDITSERFKKDAEEIEQRPDNENIEEESEEFDLQAANTYKPSTIGVSFLTEVNSNSILNVKASGGRYRRKTITIEGKGREWWLRSPVSIWGKYEQVNLDSGEAHLVSTNNIESINTEGLDMKIEVFSRPFDKIPGTRLITVCLVNRTSSCSTTVDELCLFQSYFEVWFENSNTRDTIYPYPSSNFNDDDPEVKSLNLLYRNAQTFAVGHGCAADWETSYNGQRAVRISAECMPAYETPSITPDIIDEYGSPVVVSMSELAGLVEGKDGFDSLARVIELYSNWINNKFNEIPLLELHHQETARRHLDECKRCEGRMRAGLEYLLNNHTARKAFKLANHAMLLQQISSRFEKREAVYDGKNQRFNFSTEFKPITLSSIPAGVGQWRAFQIAFLLTSITSSCQEPSPERETVELIWFPTGGGKTEAYLGLAAYSILMRRLNDPTDTGVHVLMRYTLRLLTSQQFQRASSLACSLEFLRINNTDILGEIPFAIGIWLGASSTPNSKSDAKTALRNLSKGIDEENPFVLDRCPWCGAHMGRIKNISRKSRVARVLGYMESEGTVIFKCPEGQCFFHNQKLPVYVIDEDIYEKRPDLIIGTVDKFAMLAYKPQARSLFGIGENGERLYSPPGLIIQDELHLISGPLGSMVGLYETVIEELCTDYRGEHALRPKIICSTATIRRYKEQVQALYGRDDVVLFPPSGISIDDSFFSRYDRDSDGNARPGRMYVGIHALGHGSMQTTQVRVFTALLQAPFDWDNEARDPWWTSLIFFNSLRELGTTLSLFQSDIPDYLKVLKNRIGYGYDGVRRLNSIKELTSRLLSSQIPEAIQDLSVRCTANAGHPVDACLASNIIEVGIDIDRLSLMCVVGQPKATSQYIQVTGRVGRKWIERPGLVVTLYSPSKPRDRSHFEKFRSYHQCLYAQVEPVSVTPFSPPALERALHAILTIYARNYGDKTLAMNPYPFPQEMVNKFIKVFSKRIENLEPLEREKAMLILEKRINQWHRWEPICWNEASGQNIPLLRYAGDYARPEAINRSWPTPTSMRNVDAECHGQILRPPAEQQEE